MLAKEKIQDGTQGFLKVPALGRFSLKSYFAGTGKRKLLRET